MNYSSKVFVEPYHRPVRFWNSAVPRFCWYLDVTAATYGCTVGRVDGWKDGPEMT